MADIAYIVPLNKPSSGSGASQASATITTTSLANAAIDSTQHATIGTAGFVVSVVGDSTNDCWLTLYSSTTARTNDSERTPGTTITQGSGVLWEGYVGANITLIAVGATYCNLDSPPVSNIPCRVVNEGSTGVLTLTLHVVQNIP